MCGLRYVRAKVDFTEDRAGGETPPSQRAAYQACGSVSSCGSVRSGGSVWSGDSGGGETAAS